MAFKMASRGFIDQLALSRQWAASSAYDAVKGGVDGATGAAESFWNEDYTGFSRAAEGASAVVEGATAFGMATAFGFAIHRGPKAMVSDWARRITGKAPATYIDEVRHWKGISAAKGPAGASILNDYRSKLPNGPNSYKAYTTAAETTMNKGVKGVWRHTGNMESGRFIRNSRLMSPVGSVLTLAAGLAIPMAARATFGFAGQLMDEAHMAYQQAKYHTYDTREFNNRQMYEWNMNKQNQMMTNMMPYEQNMMSMARIYHSR